MKNQKDSFEEYESLQCIWMSSSLVKYKLCDCNFNCDNCLFDKVMRNTKAEIEDFLSHRSNQDPEMDLITSTINKFIDAEFSKNLIYLKNNLVLKRLFNDTYYLGLNPMAYALIDQISAYNYCRDNKDKKIGEPLIQFTGNWGSISVPSPINFFCLGRLKPELNDLQLNSWFSLIETEERDLKSAIMTEDEINALRNESIELISTSQKLFPEVGITLNDGGEKIKYLYQAIGQLNYYTLLKRLFNL